MESRLRYRLLHALSQNSLIQTLGSPGPEELLVACPSTSDFL